MNEEEDVNLEDLAVTDDCPAELVGLFDASKSAWRKAVIKQFIELHDWKGMVKRRLARIEKYEKIILALLAFVVGVSGKEMVLKAIEYLAGLL